MSGGILSPRAVTAGGERFAVSVRSHETFADFGFVEDIGIEGTNGEFHTCVYDGPMFRKAIPIESGEVVEREGFVFTDVRLMG